VLTRRLVRDVPRLRVRGSKDKPRREKAGSWNQVLPLARGLRRGGDRQPNDAKSRGRVPQNSRRRELTLSASSGNWWVGQTRCRSKGSPRGTLFVTTLSLTKFASACEDETCRVQVPLGGFSSLRVTNSIAAVNHNASSTVVVFLLSRRLVSASLGGNDQAPQRQRQPKRIRMPRNIRC
jgi:hypothetical protein